MGLHALKTHVSGGAVRLFFGDYFCFFEILVQRKLLLFTFLSLFY